MLPGAANLHVEIADIILCQIVVVSYLQLYNLSCANFLSFEIFIDFMVRVTGYSWFAYVS